MFWALNWAVSRNLSDDFYLDINCVMKLTALLAVANLYLCHWSANCKLANLCLWFISSANSTVLRPIAFPRSALCLRVSCKINKNYECETLSPLHHRFCCKFPRIPKKPRKMESQSLKGDFIKNYFFILFKHLCYETYCSPGGNTFLLLALSQQCKLRCSRRVEPNCISEIWSLSEDS